MKKLGLETLKVESFATDAVVGVRGTVAAHEATVLGCPESYGGTCVFSACFPCYTDDPCN